MNYNMILKKMFSMREGEKMLYIGLDGEWVIEKRRKSHEEKSYKGINPKIVIVDELALLDNQE